LIDLKIEGSPDFVWLFLLARNPLKPSNYYCSGLKMDFEDTGRKG
jgi:hypothetical protein